MPVQLPPDSGLPPKPGKLGGVWEKIENVLIRFASGFIDSTRVKISELFQHAFGSSLETLEKEGNDLAGGLYAQLLDIPGLPPVLRNLLERSRSGKKQAGVVGVITIIVGATIVGVAAFFQGTGAIISYVGNRLTMPFRLDFGTWFHAYRRDPRHYPQALKEALDLGWQESQVHAAELALESRPGIAENIALMHRGKIGATEFATRLNAEGVNAGAVADYLELAKPIPGPADLISMGVREAWNDAVAGEYGYDQDFPAPFGEWMVKQGYDVDWAHKWWRAHWQIPGPTMAAEMLHRTSMTEGQYATLLKVADYPAKYRQWMTEIAYAPYTRVDIRRMYQVGVLKTYAELVRAYKDIGYKEDKAQKLSDFTVLEYGETEREATKAEVISAYQIGRLSRTEATGYLDEMGYPGWVIEMYLVRADLTRTVALAKEQITYVKTMYIAGQMSRLDVNATLGKIPLPGDEVNRYLEEWEIARLAKIARPSRTDLRKFWLQNTLTEAEFRAELRGYRLSDRYIDWYVADAKIALVLTAQEQSEKAKAEVLKVSLAAEKTAYDIQIAAYAVQIAQLNLTIADLKASATEEMTPEEVATISALLVKCALDIKRLQLKKAETWAAYLKEKGGS